MEVAVCRYTSQEDREFVSKGNDLMASAELQKGLSVGVKVVINNKIIKHLSWKSIWKELFSVSKSKPSKRKKWKYRVWASLISWSPVKQDVHISPLSSLHLWKISWGTKKKRENKDSGVGGGGRGRLMTCLPPERVALSSMTNLDQEQDKHCLSLFFML